MNVTLQVFSDYVCPFCYLGEIPLQAAAAKAGATIVHRAYQLREAGPPRLDPQGEPAARAWREVVQPMAERLGARMRPPTRVPLTRLAHEAAAWARSRHAFAPFHRALFDAYFQEDLDLGEIEALKTIAFRVGLNPADLAAALAEGRFADEVAEDQLIARTYGVTGVPTLVLGGQLLYGIREEAAILAAIEAVRDGRADALRETPPVVPVQILRR